MCVDATFDSRFFDLSQRVGAVASELLVCQDKTANVDAFEDSVQCAAAVQRVTVPTTLKLGATLLTIRMNSAELLLPVVEAAPPPDFAGFDADLLP